MSRKQRMKLKNAPKGHNEKPVAKSLAGVNVSKENNSACEPTAETVNAVSGVKTVEAVKTVEVVKEVIQQEAPVVEVPKVELNHNTKIKRNLSLSIVNDNDLENLSNKIGLAKSKIVDIVLSKLFHTKIDNEFDLYELEIKNRIEG